MAVQDTDKFIVNRGGTDYKVSASRIDDKLQDDDEVLIHRGGTDYKVSGWDLKEYLGLNKPPWEGHDGGIWHVKNVALNNIQFKRSYPAFTIAGKSLGDISKIQTAEEVIFLTSKDCTNLFQDNDSATWDFGDITDTSLVENFSYLLNNCRRFNGDVSYINTKNATTLAGMFSRCEEFDQPVEALDVSKVKYMQNMFSDCKVFNHPVNRWNTSNLVLAGNLFANCTLFNQPLNNWNVGNVTDFSFMFHYATAFNQDLNNWDIRSGTTLDRMFYYAKQFNGDIDKWDTSSVRSMSWFLRDSGFSKDISEWCVSQFSTEPPYFCYGSPLYYINANKPVWGTCPRGEDKS